MKPCDKIARMHSLFGVALGKKCKDCMHFYRNETRAGKLYRKCEVYGNSNCESTDWNASFEACGLFNTETEQRDMIHTFMPQRKMREELEGQMSLDEFDLSDK